jgi:hypothetical protein
MSSQLWLAPVVVPTGSSVVEATLVDSSVLVVALVSVSGSTAWVVASLSLPATSMVPTEVEPPEPSATGPVLPGAPWVVGAVDPPLEDVVPEPS